MTQPFKEVGFSSQRILGETPGMWQGFYNELTPFSKVQMYKNDFVSWIADEWTATDATAGTQDIADARGGILRLTSAAGENQGNNLQLGGTGDTETTGESWAPAAGKNLWFEAYISQNDVLQNDIFVGLHNEDTTIIARGSDYIGFYTVDGSAALNVQSANTSVVSSGLGVATLVNATFAKVGFKVSGLDKIEFYVNDVLVETIMTNIPTALMKLSISSITGEASANYLDLDWIVVAQDR